MKRTSILSLLLIPILLFACASESGKDSTAAIENDTQVGQNANRISNVPSLPVPADSFLIGQVKSNLTGLNNEDLAWAMEPLHMSSPYMQDPEYHIRGAFLVYEMNFQLVSVDIEFKSDTACVAKVIHDSRNDNERDYVPQRSVQRYTWKPEGDQWKIWKMEVLGNTPL